MLAAPSRKETPVPEVARLSVELVAWTEFRPPTDLPWRSQSNDGQGLIEFAGRSCYRAWERNNPATATNAGYLDHLVEVGHLAALEHASATFYLTGISRALGAELTRHRHFSFSELSPRYVADVARIVEPAAVAADPELHAAFTAGVEEAEAAHRSMLQAMLERYATSEAAGLPRKAVRQAARTLQPGALETTLVMTGNYRAWRQLIGTRAADHADRELRTVLIECLRRLIGLAPAVFADFAVTALPDGSEVASSLRVGDQ
jgi:thymidylate synthase (FAD)